MQGGSFLTPKEPYVSNYPLSMSLFKQFVSKVKKLASNSHQNPPPTGFLGKQVLSDLDDAGLL